MYVHPDFDKKLVDGVKVYNEGLTWSTGIDATANALILVPGFGEVFGPLWYTADVISIIANGKGLSENLANAMGKK